MNIDLRGKRITELDFSTHDPEHAEPREVAALRQISHIDVSNNEIAVLRRLQIFTGLTMLNISRNKLSGTIQGLVGQLPRASLTALDLSYNSFSSIVPMSHAQPTFAVFPALRQLDLSHNKIFTPSGDDECAALFPESLESLDLGWNELHGVGDVVQGCHRLRSLNLQSNRLAGIESSGLHFVALDCPALQSLTLNGNPIVTFLGERYAEKIRGAFSGTALELLDGKTRRDEGNVPPQQPVAVLAAVQCPPKSGRLTADTCGDETSEYCEQKGFNAADSRGALPRDCNPAVESDTSMSAPPSVDVMLHRSTATSAPPRSPTRCRTEPAALLPEGQQDMDRVDSALPTLGVSAARVKVVRSGTPADAPTASVQQRAQSFVVHPCAEDTMVDRLVMRGSVRQFEYTGKYAARIQELQQLAVQFEATLATLQGSSQQLMTDNALLDGRLREARRHVSGQLRELAALKAERESLEANVAAMTVASRKTAAEVHHARLAADLQTKASAHRARADSPPRVAQSSSRGRAPNIATAKTPYAQLRKGSPVAVQEPAAARTTKSAEKRLEATQRKLLQLEADQFFMPAERFSYAKEMSRQRSAENQSQHAVEVPRQDLLHPFDAARIRALHRQLYGSPTSHSSEGNRAVPMAANNVLSETDHTADEHDGYVSEEKLLFEDDDSPERRRGYARQSTEFNSTGRANNVDTTAMTPTDEYDGDVTETVAEAVAGHVLLPAHVAGGSCDDAARLPPRVSLSRGAPQEFAGGTGSQDISVSLPSDISTMLPSARLSHSAGRSDAGHSSQWSLGAPRGGGPHRLADNTFNQLQPVLSTQWSSHGAGLDALHALPLSTTRPNLR